MNNLVIFDGHCILCSRFIDFLLKKDKKKCLFFTSNESGIANEIVTRNRIKLPPDNSIIFADDKLRIYTQSDAIINIFSKLGGIWSLFVIFKIVPKPLRDYMYNAVARSRYTIFGRTEVCRIHPKTKDNRIIE